MKHFHFYFWNNFSFCFSWIILCVIWTQVLHPGWNAVAPIWKVALSFAVFIFTHLHTIAQLVIYKVYNYSITYCYHLSTLLYCRPCRNPISYRPPHPPPPFSTSLSKMLNKTRSSSHPCVALLEAAHNDSTPQFIIFLILWTFSSLLVYLTILTFTSTLIHTLSKISGDPETTCFRRVQMHYRTFTSFAQFCNLIWKNNVVCLSWFIL